MSEEVQKKDISLPAANLSGAALAWCETRQATSLPKISSASREVTAFP
jgi:hypothetical protein